MPALCLGLSVVASRGLLVSVDPPTNLDSPFILGSEIGEQASLLNSGNWQPEPVILTYQWFLNGVPIDGATGEVWTIAGNDGDEFYVEVTGHNAGGASAPAISNSRQIEGPA